MTASPQNTGTFMLSKEIEILMAEREKLLRVAGRGGAVRRGPGEREAAPGVATEAEILAESVNALSEDTLKDALASITRANTEAAMNPDAFNMSIRKFLKHVGVHSQREIEAAVERGHGLRAS